MLLLLTHTLLADQTIQSKAGNHQGRGAGSREVRAALAGTRSALFTHLSLQAQRSPASSSLLQSNTGHLFFFFSLFLFSLKLNPLVAFGNEWIAELISFLKKKMLVPHRQTHAVHCTGSDTPLLRRGRPGAGGPWTSLTQTCRLTGSGAVLRVSRLRSAQSWTGARSQQLCHCSVFRKG